MCGKLASVSYSRNFILAFDIRATEPEKKVQLRSYAVPAGKLNFSKAPVLVAVRKESYFVDSGRNSAEINFALEGGVLA